MVVVELKREVVGADSRHIGKPDVAFIIAPKDNAMVSCWNLAEPPLKARTVIQVTALRLFRRLGRFPIAAAVLDLQLRLGEKGTDKSAVVRCGVNRRFCNAFTVLKRIQASN